MSAAVTRRPILFLLIAFGLALLALPSLRALRFDSSIERLTVQGAPDWVQLREAIATFGSDDVLVVAEMGVSDAVDLERLSRLRNFSEQLAELDGVDQVWSITETGHLVGDSGIVEVQNLFDDLPEEVAARNALQADLLDSRLYRDHLLSRDGRATAVVIFPEDRPDDPLLRDRLVAGVRGVMQRHPGPEKLVVSGNPSVTVDMAATMESEQNLFTAATLVMLVVLLAFLFRSPWAVVFPLGAAGITVLIVLGTTTALGRSISVLSTIVPSLVLALGTSYSIHLLHDFARSGSPPRDRARASITRLALPLSLSALTTMVGFGALGLQRIPAIREFGVMAAGAVGIVALAVAVVGA